MVFHIFEKETLIFQTMMLITGATGQLGTSTIEFLLKRTAANNIAAMIRDPTKSGELKAWGVDVRTADYDYPDALERAFQGVDKLMLISGNNVGKRVQQHKNVIEAAKKAGVTHIIYTSMYRSKQKSSSVGEIVGSHAETENYIKRSGLNYTIMLNTLYADMLPLFFGNGVLETGIFLPAGNGKASFAARKDMAEAAACIFTGKGHENKEFVIANTQNYTMDEIAGVLSEMAGKKIPYLNPSRDAFIETLAGKGIPEEIILLTADFSEAIKNGELETTHTDFVNLTGREPITMEAFLRQVYSPS
jgi:NAD(P)H dehydrogenase (quinone)